MKHELPIYLEDPYPYYSRVENVLSGNMGTVQLHFVHCESLYPPDSGDVPVLWDGKRGLELGICPVRKNIIKPANFLLLTYNPEEDNKVLAMNVKGEFDS